jgi:hypothetical protein
MYREELKEELTCDAATLTETVYGIIDMIFDKGCVTKYDVQRFMGQKIYFAPECLVWTVDDVMMNYNCRIEEASAVIDILNNSEYAISQVNDSLDDICENLGLVRKNND